MGKSNGDRGENVKSLKRLRINSDFSMKHLPEKQLLPICQSPGEVYLRLHDYQHALKYQEEMRHKFALLEMELTGDRETLSSAIVQLEKVIEYRRAMDSKIDAEYRGKIEEALKNHLLAVKTNHERRSQVEGEAKRNNRVLQEAMFRGHKKARIEAEISCAREVIERKPKQGSEKSTSETTEELRPDFRQYQLQVGRLIRQIPGSVETVRKKANELIKIMNNPQCPQSISIAAFAKKIVLQSQTLDLQDSTAFAYGHVMVLVTCQVPAAMDILLAEFHRVCIYTVPNYVVKSRGLDKQAHLKLLGYTEEDGKMETREHYLGRMESCIKLYGALIQTETEEAQNHHGLQQGWTWLARLLNTLPANIYTATALNAFLKIAGFALYRRYKSQFRKILNVVKEKFVMALEAAAAEDPGLNAVVVNIKNYIDTNQFVKESEGWRLHTTPLLSHSGGYHCHSDY